jgi:hypothetical protein
VLPTRALGQEEEDARRTLEAMKTSELEAFRASGHRRQDDRWHVRSDRREFDDYVVLNRQTMQDVSNLRRHRLPALHRGEKHLIFVTEQGFRIPRAITIAIWRRWPRTHAWRSTRSRPAASPPLVKAPTSPSSTAFSWPR